MREELTLIEDTANRLFADHVTPAVLREAEAGRFAADLWAALVDAGLAAARSSEAGGGTGLGFPAAGLIMRAAGYHTLPVALAEHMLAAYMLDAARLTCPDGLIALADGGTLSYARGKLSGGAAAVPDARHAAHILAVLPQAERVTLALVPAKAALITPDHNMAGEARDHVTFKDAQASAVGEAALPANAVRLFGALMRAGQMAGALSRALDLAVAYANERVQFSKPIAKFQAIQHQLAVLAEEAAAAEGAATLAFDWAARPARETAIAAAKIRAGLAVTRGVGIAHQVHGAIDFTLEHSLQFATRRLWSWRSEYGAERDWSLLLGRKAAAAGGEGVWPLVVGV